MRKRLWEIIEESKRTEIERWARHLLFVFIYGLIRCCNGMYSWKEDHINAFHVGDKVMCHDCSQGWNQWVHGSSPIKGARVALPCMDERKRVVHHASDETDQEGDFEIMVDKSIQGKKPVASQCSVRLVSSPDQQCNVLTDFARGKSGAWLTQPLAVYRGVMNEVHTLGPFYFTSPMCEEPDTEGVEKGGKY